MIALTREEAVAVISIDRPERRNALTVAMVHELTGLVRGAGEDPSVSAIVVTGRGGAFCAGQDLADRYREPGAPPPDLGASLDGAWNPLIRAIRSAKPVVTAVNGVAAGAGANLALSGHAVVAAESAWFVESFVRLGLMPDCGGTWLLTRVAGRARAAGLMLLGDGLDAGTAADWGLVDAVVPDDVLLKTAIGLAGGGGW